MYGVIVVVIFGALIWLVSCSVISNNKEYDEFMADCLKDHKKYECTTMWRQGTTDTIVVPVPVYTNR